MVTNDREMASKSMTFIQYPRSYRKLERSAKSMFSLLNITSQQHPQSCTNKTDQKIELKEGGLDKV